MYGSYNYYAQCPLGFLKGLLEYRILSSIMKNKKV